MTEVTNHEEILRFWFGPPDGPPFANQARWWTKDPAFDETIRARFGTDLETAAAGGLRDWEEAPRSRLALVLVLDQFSRNAFRDTARAFAQDGRALALCRDGIARGLDRALALVERYFFYMPLMHAEDLAIQQTAVATFARLADEAPLELRGGFEAAVDFAERHRAIIERFGRFPHRNAILGRESTPEEAEFLTQPNSSF